MNSKQPGDAQRTLNRPLFIIFLSRTALNTAHRIIYPFLPAIARGLGISLTAASGLITMRLVAGMASPFIGPVADRHSRRRVMEIALLVFILANLLLVGFDFFGAAAIAFALFGLSKVIYDPTIHAYVGDTVPYNRRGRAVGFIEMSWSTAWLLGVPVSGFLIEEFGWRAPWIVMSGLGLFSIWLTHASLPPDHHSLSEQTDTSPARLVIQSWRYLLRRRRVIVLLLISMLLVASTEILFIVYGDWLETSFDLSLGTLGIASIFVGLAEATAELGTMTLTDRLGKRRSVIIGLIGSAISLVVLSGLARLGVVAAMGGVVLVTLTFEFAMVSLLPLATEVVPEARASLLSLNVTAFSLGRILGAAAGSWLWAWGAGDIKLNAIAGAACALAAALLMARGMVEIKE